MFTSSKNRPPVSLSLSLSLGSVFNQKSGTRKKITLSFLYVYSSYLSPRSIPHERLDTRARAHARTPSRSLLLSLSLFHEEEEEEEEQDEDVMMMKSINNFYFMPTSLEEGTKKSEKTDRRGGSNTRHRDFTPQQNTPKNSFFLFPHKRKTESSFWRRASF
jgi:hypothetical protein